MTTVRNSTPITKRDGTTATNHTIRVYRRDTGAFLSETKTAGENGVNVTSSWVSNNDSPGWSGYTIRHKIGRSLLGVCNNIRVTISAGLYADAIISSVYIGYADPTEEGTTSYSFLSTPTQAFYGGNAGTTILGGTSATTDWIPFNYDGTSSLIVSFYMGGTTNIRRGLKQSNLDWSSVYKNANDAATISGTGYTDENSLYGMTQIETKNTLLPGYYIASCGTYVGDVNVICLDESGGANDLITRTSPV